MKSAIPAEAGGSSSSTLSRSGRGLASTVLLVLALHAWALAEWAGAGEHRPLPGSPVAGLFRVLQLIPASSEPRPTPAVAPIGPAAEQDPDLAETGDGRPAVDGLESLALTAPAASAASAALAALAEVEPSIPAVEILSAAPGTALDAGLDGVAGVVSAGASVSNRAAGLRQESDAAPAPDVLMLDGQAYWPSRALQRTPLPSSSPDLALLRGVATSGLPVQVRVFIDAQGVVREVVALQAGAIDAEFVDRLRRMFLRTRFVPGVRAGQAVAGYRDLEFSITAVQD